MEITIKDVKINIPEQQIGIKCSGGADSSLLLYILMTYSKFPIHVFSGAFKPKNRAVIFNTPAVINKCIELTGKTDVYQHIVFIENEYQSVINDFASKVLPSVDFIYSATTSFPPDEVVQNFKDKSVHPDVYQDRNPNFKKSTKHLNLYRPFINIDKKKIKEIYDYLDISDTLFPLTRSCESTKIITGHCGKCWWCEERFWAFNRYN